MYCYLEEVCCHFFEDLGNVIEKTVTSSSELIILGDFNVKADVQNSSDAMSLGDCLEIFNLQNHVSFPTHDKGHTLDLILADVNNKVVREVSLGDLISVHCFIDCQLDVHKPQKETQYRQCHSIKNGQEIPRRTSEPGFINTYRKKHLIPKWSNTQTNLPI